MAIDHIMTRAEKEQFIWEKLHPHGLTKNGVIQLAPLEQVIILLQETSLPTNAIPRPVSPASGGQGINLQEYRNEMKAHLEPWVRGLPETMKQNVYEALADYCESITNTTPSQGLSGRPLT